MPSSLSPYEKAYLLELRAGLVVTSEVVTAQRLFNYKDKLAPEVRQYLKALPDAEQPISLQGMHRAVRKWAEIQREGQPSGKKNRWEQIDNLQETNTKKQKEKEKKAKQKAEREKKEKEEENKRHQQAQSSAGNKKPLWEHLSMIAQTAQRLQAFAKGKGKGGKQGPWPGANQTKDWSKEMCHICGGKHLAQLRGREQCPNTVAEANGTAEANKRNNTKCTHWIDKHKTECGGSHSFEDHKVALTKFRDINKKGKGKGKGKEGRKGKKGKGKDKFHEFAEDETYMDKAEFATWLYGTQTEYWTDGMQCLIDRDGPEIAMQTVPPPPEPLTGEGTLRPLRQLSQGEGSPKKLQFRLVVPAAPTWSRNDDGMSADEMALTPKSAEGGEVLGMMADMVMCQTCHRRLGMYQCAYCAQINCTECTTDDPERVACPFPCQGTESRPTKRLRHAPMGLRSASRVAVSELRRALESEDPLAGSTAVTTCEVASQRTGDYLVACLQERVVDLDGEQLPSEKVGTPMAPGSGLYPLIVAVTLCVVMAVLDICAWFWYIWDFAASLCGRQPPRCNEQCRVVVDRTVTPRILCSQQCCWPADHGTAFHHCCRVHQRYGGRL